MGKGEIARYEQFLLFPVFSKGLFPKGVKRCHCVGMGYLFTTESRLLTTPGKRPFENMVETGENDGKPAIFPLPTMFSIPPETNFNF